MIRLRDAVPLPPRSTGCSLCGRSTRGRTLTLLGGAHFRDEVIPICADHERTVRDWSEGRGTKYRKPAAQSRRSLERLRQSRRAANLKGVPT